MAFIVNPVSSDGDPASISPRGKLATSDHSGGCDDAIADDQTPPLSVGMDTPLPTAIDGVDGQPSSKCDEAAVLKVSEREQRKAEKRKLKEAADNRRTLRLADSREQKGRNEAKVGVTLNMYFQSSRNSMSDAPLSWSEDKPSMSVAQDSGDTVLVSATPPRSNPAVRLITKSPIPLPDLKGKGKKQDPPSRRASTGEVHKRKGGLARAPSAAESGGSRSSLPVEVLSDEAQSQSSGSDDFQNLPPTRMRRRTREYDRNRRYHFEWSAKFPWATGVVEDGFHFVKCIVCSTIDGRVKLMGAKTDTLFKHEGNRKATKDDPVKGIKKGEMFLAKNCRHQRNMVLFAKRQPESIIQQVNHINASMRRKKRVQLATLFEVLSNGRPMLEYEQRQELYNFLSMPELPRMHWTDTSGWCMAESMYDVVKTAITAKVKKAAYIALTCDEVTSVDNTSWMSVHCYVVENWIRIPLLLTVQKMTDGATAEVITTALTEILKDRGGLSTNEIRSRLVSFGADGAAVFQGIHTGVAKRLLDSHAPFMQPVHCFAHRCNLAFKSLSSIQFMVDIEQLLASVYAYFNKSPKRFQEFRDLAEVMDCRGLKLLRNVVTRWNSILDPLRRLVSQYRPIMAKMYQSMTTEPPAKACFEDMLDPIVLLGMVAIIPMIEAIDVLITFAQKPNVFIQDFVGALDACLTQLFKYYCDSATAFATDEFTNFRALLELSHFNIFMRWDTDLNSNTERLIWKLNGVEVVALRNGNPVDRGTFSAMAADVKIQCKGAATHLIGELNRRFPSVNILNAMGFLYPQYWAAPDCLETFPHHLEVIKRHFCETKTMTVETRMVVPGLLSAYDLDSEQTLFKLFMTNNFRACCEPPFLVNPLTQIWRLAQANGPLAGRFPAYMKLAEIAVVMVLGSVEDERTFSSVAFLKSKLRNSLDPHLGVVVGMFSQKMFDIRSFPYDDAFSIWYNSADRCRYGSD